MSSTIKTAIDSVNDTNQKSDEKKIGNATSESSATTQMEQRKTANVIKFIYCEPCGLVKTVQILTAFLTENIPSTFTYLFMLVEDEAETGRLDIYVQDTMVFSKKRDGHPKSIERLNALAASVIQALV